MHTRRIMVTEDFEDLREPVLASNDVCDDTAGDAVALLKTVLRPGELLRFAIKLAQAMASGRQVMVGVEFTRGHPKRIVYHESETLERE